MYMVTSNQIFWYNLVALTDMWTDLYGYIYKTQFCCVFLIRSNHNTINLMFRRSSQNNNIHVFINMYGYEYIHFLFTWLICSYTRMWRACDIFPINHTRGLDIAFTGQARHFIFLWYFRGWCFSYNDILISSAASSQSASTIYIMDTMKME